MHSHIYTHRYITYLLFILIFVIIIINTLKISVQFYFHSFFDLFVWVCFIVCFKWVFLFGFLLLFLLIYIIIDLFSFFRVFKKYHLFLILKCYQYYCIHYFVKLVLQHIKNKKKSHICWCFVYKRSVFNGIIVWHLLHMHAWWQHMQLPYQWHV